MLKREGHLKEATYPINLEDNYLTNLWNLYSKQSETKIPYSRVYLTVSEEMERDI